MKVAIIVGFSYLSCQAKDFDYKLPGICLDIYTAYQYAKTIACDKILVVTDQTDYNIDVSLLKLMLNGQVSTEIITIFNTLKERRELLEFTTLENFYQHLIPMARDATHLIFYYSGHAHHGMALIPKYRHRASYGISSDESSGVHVINMIDLLKPLFLETPQSTSQDTDNCFSGQKCAILCILDCCSSEGLHLPYKLILKTRSNRTYYKDMLTKEDLKNAIDKGLTDYKGGYRLLNLNNWFGGRDIVCISVSNISFSSHFGSKFTLKLFELLLSKEINSFISLNLKLNYDLLSTADLYAQIRCSYPNRYLVQPWMREKGTVSVYYDEYHQVFRISSDGEDD